ncbi:MAG: hypothetical protein HOB32_09325 [Nitrospina sp.]|jgi:tetratricopeptide (TPR) repeat protein|nr:hypothetical protein [Nitrospina sp.]MBT6601835.1 hypothetical protein [Nitrospina sp.]
MIIFSTILWVTSAIVSPTLGEIEFDHFRQLKKQEIKEHLRLVQDDPLDAVEYFNLGLAYMAMGLHRQEIDSYLEAIRLDSSYPKAHFNLAIAYDIIKYGREALDHARKAEVLYDIKKKHRKVRKIRRLLNILNEKYK